MVDKLGQLLWPHLQLPLLHHLHLLVDSVDLAVPACHLHLLVETSVDLVDLAVPECHPHLLVETSVDLVDLAVLECHPHLLVETSVDLLHPEWFRLQVVHG